MQEQKHSEIFEEGNWYKKSKYFKKAKISVLSILKMILQTDEIGNCNMGNLQGYLDEESFIVTDSFSLPNQNSSSKDEFSEKYCNLTKKSGRSEPIIGWWRTQPGLGCWLARNSIKSQSVTQVYQKPYLVITVDPIQTVSKGQIQAKAFTIDEYGDEQETYSLEIEYFKSSSDTHLLDLLWKKYWMKTLSSSTFNQDYVKYQIQDLFYKIENIEIDVQKSSKEKETELSKLTEDTVKLSTEVLRGVMNQSVKSYLFN